MLLSLLKRKEPSFYLFTKLWQYANLRDRRHIALYVAMFIIANLFMLVGPYLFGKIINTIQQLGINEENLAYVVFLISLIFVKELCFWLFHGPARVIERVAGYRIALQYRKFLLEGILALDLSWHNTHDSGDSLDKVQKSVEGLKEFGGEVFQIIQIIVRIVGTTAIVLWLYSWVAALVFILVIASLYITLQFDKKLLPQYLGLNDFANKAAASFFDALANVTSVKILHIEVPVGKGVMARFTDALPLFKLNAKLNEWKWFSGILLFQGISVFPLIGFIIYKVKTQQSVDAGAVSTLYLYLADLMFAYYSFASFYDRLFTFRNQVMNTEPLEEAIKNHKIIPKRSIDRFHQLNLSHIRFSYGEKTGASGSLAFENLAFSFKRGERIAIIGESGSGKTTFLKIIHGLFANAYGWISVDDQPSFATTFADLDLGTMLVPQEPELFSSSIRENLTLGIAYSEEQVLRATKIAGFSSVLANLPRGLESVINEKGVNLSGGQKQRLALARAVLFAESKEVILLDESTSSVDAENEMIIYRHIFAEFNDKTIIASIHKMNLLRLFDRIVIFDKNAIVDQGTFAELLSRNEVFKGAWQRFVGTHTP